MDPSRIAHACLPSGRRQEDAQMTAIFISYRRRDTAEVTDRIYRRLEAHWGPGTVYRDVDRIPLGVDFKDHIDKAIGHCRVTLVVIGSQWLTIRGKSGQRRLDDPDDLVRIEIEWSLERGNRVIPLLVDGARMSGPNELPPSIRTLVGLNGMAIDTGASFGRDMDRLTRKLRRGSERDEAVEAARECLLDYEYDAAAFRLRNVDQDFCDQEVQRLLEEAETGASECIRLAAAAAEAADHRQEERLRELLRELWALKPNEEAIRQLIGDLCDRLPDALRAASTDHRAKGRGPAG